MEQEMEQEQDFLQILTKLSPAPADITKIDSSFLNTFTQQLCAEKSIRGIVKIEDIEKKFEDSLNMIDELLRVDRLYNTINNTLNRVSSNIELNYFEFISKIFRSNGDKTDE